MTCWEGVWCNLGGIIGDTVLCTVVARMAIRIGVEEGGGCIHRSSG